MINWKETTLGEACKILSGSTPSTEDSSFWDGNISWITPKDLSGFNGTFIEKGERNITEAGLRNSSAQLLTPNTILFSSRAPIGYVAIAKKELTTNQGFKNIVCDEKITHFQFIYYWLKFKSNLIEKRSSGSTFSEASASLMRSLEIDLPPIEEQKEIAGVLSSLDDKIELLREKNKTLEATAQAIFKEWFVNFNFPGATDKMIDSELGEIPEEWRIGRLSDVADITIGRTPPRKESEWFSTDSNDVKWISIKDMGNCGVYTGDTAEYLTRDAVERFNIPVIPKNTAVVSFKMTVGRVSITVEEMLSNEAIAHIKLKKDGLTVEYIYLFLKNFNFSDLGSTSSIVNATNSTAIKNLSVLIPEKNIIDEFDSAVGSVFQKILTNSEQIQTLSTLRDTLLPKLMSGDLRIK